MIRTVLFLGAASIAVGCITCDSRAPSSSPSVSLKTTVDSMSYAIGEDVGAYLKRFNAELNLEVLTAALVRRYTEAGMQLPDSLMDSLRNRFQKGVNERRRRAQREEAETNKKESEAFLTENSEKLGVMTTESGLQYKIIKKGTGPRPDSGARVTVNYRGTLVDGTEFDSSYKRGKPATFTLGRVIPGLTEGLQLMNAGSSFRFFIPPDLAYGERDAPKIGPNAALIFDVELIAIED